MAKIARRDRAKSPVVVDGVVGRRIEGDILDVVTGLGIPRLPNPVQQLSYRFRFAFDGIQESGGRATLSRISEGNCVIVSFRHVVRFLVSDSEVSDSE